MFSLSLAGMTRNMNLSFERMLGNKSKFILVLRYEVYCFRIGAFWPFFGDTSY